MEEVVTQSKVGIKIKIRVKPGSSRNAVLGIGEQAGEGPILVIAVSAPPQDGKANEAVIQLLSKCWKIAKSRIHVASGPASRIKLIEIIGDSVSLLDQIKGWLLTIPKL